MKEACERRVFRLEGSAEKNLKEILCERLAGFKYLRIGRSASMVMNLRVQRMGGNFRVKRGNEAEMPWEHLL
jgi:hypothetical protein